MGTPRSARGPRKDDKTPVSEKGKGPCNLKHVQGASHIADAGASLAGQTMDSSSAVRVIDVKAAVSLTDGAGAFGGRRQIAKVSGSFRNFRCIVTSVLLIDDIAELCSAWTGGTPVPPSFVLGCAYCFFDRGLGQQAG